MDITLTLQDLLKLILFLLGIGVLGYLLLLLRNINKIIGKAEEVIEANMNEIDITIKQLPDITQNVNSITGEANKLIANITPDVEGMVKNVNGITSKVDRLAGVADDVANVIDSTGQKVGSTVDVLTDTIAETALAFQFNAKNVTSYIELIKEIVEIVRDSLKKY
ncbi:MAG: hypothetical protein RBR71_03860 [Gudongella sp.]|nr:hypothetical protein [Gudongella sp.]